MIGRDQFERWARCADREVDLARAALDIARDEYPRLDTDTCVARLDAMANATRDGLNPGAPSERVLDAVVHRLFEVEGFRGNATEYYDPRNSYLNDVLERRLGIPITLSVVVLEVGWRLGLALEPVGFPGHFLVRLGGAEPAVVLDPFHGGGRVSESELAERLRALHGSRRLGATLVEALAPVPRREVVARMLRNLKMIYARAEDWPRALRITDRLVTLAPEVAPERRDRGRLYDQLGVYGAAVDDYARYLEQAPDADDAELIRERLEALRDRAGRLH